MPKGNVDKFKGFLDVIIQSNNAKLALRNDGSSEVIRSYFGESYLENIREVLDNGFFYKPQVDTNTFTGGDFLLINLTIDQLLMKNKKAGKVDADRYLAAFQSFVDRIIKQTDIDIVFVPHIYSDIKAFQQILEGLNDYYIRTRVSIAPFIQGDRGCNFLFSIYKDAKAVIGMRYHSNVCSLALNKNPIGLAALDRIYHMYDSLGMVDRVVFLKAGFEEKLFEKTMNQLNSDADSPPETIEIKKRESINNYKEMFKELEIL